MSWGVTEVLVIGHTDCGVQHIDSEMMIHHMKNRGISQESIDLMKYCGIDFEKWLAGFDTVEDSVRETVDTIRNHPLIPKDVRISGFVINTETGELMPSADLQKSLFPLKNTFIFSGKFYVKLIIDSGAFSTRFRKCTYKS